MVIITINKSLNQAITHLNFALDDLKTVLDKVSFELAPEKCKSIIFTRRRYFVDHNIIFEHLSGYHSRSRNLNGFQI